jgi:hypothetical protein
MRLQTAPRGIGVITGLQCTFHPFIGFPSYKAICDLPLAERVARMRDPDFKAQCLSEKSEKLAGDGTPVPPIVDALMAAIDYVAGKTSSSATIRSTSRASRDLGAAHGPGAGRQRPGDDLRPAA